MAAPAFPCFALNQHGRARLALLPSSNMAAPPRPSTSPAHYKHGATAFAPPLSGQDALAYDWPRGGARRLLIGRGGAPRLLIGRGARGAGRAGPRHTRRGWWRRPAGGTRPGGPGPGGGGPGGGAPRKRDPFPGGAPLPRPRVRRFLRGSEGKEPRARSQRLRGQLQRAEHNEEAAATRAARSELLLPEEPGFLEADPGEDTCTITQGDIAEAVDIASAAKHFELRLEQFGPYRLDYTRTGRHLLLGGRRGHVAALDWQTKALMCEVNVLETLNDVAWLHTETMFAVAQRRWLYVYDNQGLELNCLKSFPGVLRLQFLPYHFLLATANESGFLQYLDISVGKEVAALCTRGGRLAVMAQNPATAIVHLGHSNGTVTLWSPNVKEPLVRMLCHRGAVRAAAVDPTGTYMATAGLDRKLQLWDLRTYRALRGLLLPLGAAELAFSQRGLLAAACGDLVQVYQAPGGELSPKPYLCHRLSRPPQGLRFCPFEDVLGVGHGAGFSSLLVPGAGEANFDALENNPYRSRKQRQEWEVKALLEKIPAELITLDPGQLQRVDTATMEQKRAERVERLGFDPQAKGKFQPRRRAKGGSSTGSLLRRKRKVAHEQQRAVIRKSVEQREQQKQSRTGPPPQRTALDRFKKQG